MVSLPTISASNVVLKVTPEILISKADEVLKDVNLIKEAMSTIEEKIEGTSSYWIGEAGELNRKLYSDQKDNIDDMMRRLSEHPKDLKSIAGNYSTTETQVAEAASALSDNVII